MAKVVAREVGAAPGRLATYCDWSPAADDSSIDCTVYVVLAKSAPTIADELWLAPWRYGFSFGTEKVNDLPDLGRAHGLPVAINDVQLARVGPGGELEGYSWSCDDPSVARDLNNGEPDLVIRESGSVADPARARSAQYSFAPTTTTLLRPTDSLERWPTSS
jgi:hypothetical protein